MTKTASQENLGKGTVISVNYGEENAIQTAIDANAFDYTSVDVEVDDIPLGGTGQAKPEVFELHLNQMIFSRDLPDELDRRELAFADPLTALRYAKELPDQQRKYPLAILFTNKKGRLCDLVLGGDGGGRRLFVDREGSGGGWDEDVRFLVLRKLVQSSGA